MTSSDLDNVASLVEHLKGVMLPEPSHRDGLRALIHFVEVTQARRERARVVQARLEAADIRWLTGPSEDD